MTDSELARALAQAWRSEREHVERVVLAAAVITTALDRAGMRATLVGGAAIEFYAPDAYTTADLDFVVEGRTREAIDETLTSLRMQRQGRHWVLDDLFVEVPGSYQSEPAESFEIGPFTLRVVRKEYVLGDRIIGYRWWKYAGYGLQAVDMIDAFAGELDDAALRAYLRREGAEDTYDLLLKLSASGSPPTAKELDALWHLHYS
ncbi:MAG: hypothetical protein AVDCRST_MAG68-277 [uncultured Gemmatimonadetes bacterium]|uniref:Uncharacterized protein n=1 Tax=uncultured Gemmatimonadota bacterium TaxID=203437 RepID=A0A6J4K696_9BACT|nr:MAG: hypothetical protein AVDCRST_MAG68-277 [uncultured Gemmatimonadota bacterium]